MSKSWISRCRKSRIFGYQRAGYPDVKEPDLQMSISWISGCQLDGYSDFNQLDIWMSKSRICRCQRARFQISKAGYLDIKVLDIQMSKSWISGCHRAEYLDSKEPDIWMLKSWISVCQSWISKYQRAGYSFWPDTRYLAKLKVMTHMIWKILHVRICSNVINKVYIIYMQYIIGARPIFSSYTGVFSDRFECSSNILGWKENMLRFSLNEINFIDRTDNILLFRTFCNASERPRIFLPRQCKLLSLIIRIQKDKVTILSSLQSYIEYYSIQNFFTVLRPYQTHKSLSFHNLTTTTTTITTQMIQIF